MKIMEQAHALHAWVMELRRDFHRNPELAFQEYRTTERIVEELTGMGIPCKRLEPTGVVAEISGRKDGRVIVLRADIDALPIQEETGVSYQSCRSGVMHACGHDSHAAMLLGAAQILNGLKNELKGIVRLVFQPAEEIGGGAKAVIAQHVLEGAEGAFAIHVSAGWPVGTIQTIDGVMFAASAHLRIVVKGKKGHGAFPHDSIDAVAAGSAIVMALQSVVSRETDPRQAAVVTIGAFHSDGSHNIISGIVELEGTIRAFDRNVFEATCFSVSRIAEMIAQAYRCEAKVSYEGQTDVVFNDAKMVELGRQSAKKIVPDEKIGISERFIGSEDFGEFSKVVPSAYFIVGAKGRYPSHYGKFEIDEDGLEVGTALYAQMALDSLQGVL